MSNTCDNATALLGFERSSIAVNVERQSARISKGLVFLKAKAPLYKFRLYGQFNRTLSNSGFFVPNYAASDAIDNGLNRLDAPERWGVTVAGLYPSHRSYTECTSLSRQQPSA